MPHLLISQALLCLAPRAAWTCKVARAVGDQPPWLAGTYLLCSPLHPWVGNEVTFMTVYAGLCVLHPLHQSSSPCMSGATSRRHVTLCLGFACLSSLRCLARASLVSSHLGSTPPLLLPRCSFCSSGDVLELRPVLRGGPPSDPAEQSGPAPGLPAPARPRAATQASQRACQQRL